jgi:predicted nucleic-acid-binding protein
MAFLVDTNILVYRFDPRFPKKQAIARDLLRKGLVEDKAWIPHQALLEFVSVVTRVRSGSKPLLTPEEASRSSSRYH